MFGNGGDKSSKFIQYTKSISPSPRINTIGQIGGIDTDLDGKLVVFHRGNRKWNFE
jgi:hypothetical protein